MLIEEDQNRGIAVYGKDGLENITAFNMGWKPNNFYFLFQNSTTYIQRIRIINYKEFDPIIIPPIDAVALFSLGGSVIVADTAGDITIIRDTGETIPQYSHNATITYIDSYTAQEYIVSGDVEGRVIVGNGTIQTGFVPCVQYAEHDCPIVFVILVGSFVLSSDECGLIVQYDIDNNLTLDKRKHPDSRNDGPVYLSQYLNSGFGASAKAQDSAIHLYTLDSRKNDYEGEEESEQTKVAIKMLREVCKRIVMVPCLRLFLKFSMPWFVWLQDFYYYSYHHYEYNEGVTIFLIEMYFINEEKINPVLAYITNKKYLSKHLRFNSTNYQSSYPINNLPENSNFYIYFLDYTKSIYIESLLQQFAFFLFVKAIFFCLKKCIVNAETKLAIMEFEGNTLLWFFLLAFMLDNALYLSFACSAQIRTSFSFDFMDKVNLILAVLCFFILISFSVGFFMLTRSFFPKKRIAQAALYESEATTRGFVMECLVFGVRNLLSGMIHGFLLDNHELQIILLMVVSIIISLWVYLYYKQFTYKACFYLTLFYHSGFSIFNLLVLLQIKKVNVFGIEMKDLHFNTLMIVLIIVVIRFLAEFIIFFKQRRAFKKKVTEFLIKMNIIKSNKIRPYSSEASPQKNKETIRVENYFQNSKPSETRNNKKKSQENGKKNKNDKFETKTAKNGGGGKKRGIS